MGRIEHDSLNSEFKDNLDDLIEAVDELEKLYKTKFVVRSGFRTLEDNRRCKGSPRSNHLNCSAVDLADDDGKLKQWILDNKQVLEYLDLYIEDPASTKTWLHVSIKAPASGKRIFKP